MSSNQQNQLVHWTTRLGGVLVALTIGAVVVAYPPPATGVKPLFGIGSMFWPLLVSVVALLGAVAGGVLLVRALMNRQPARLQRLAAGVFGPVGAVALISVYLVAVAGFVLQTPFIIGAVVLAVVGGLVAAVIG